MKLSLGENFQICKLKFSVSHSCTVSTYLLLAFRSRWVLCKMWSNPHLPSGFGMVSAVILPLIQNTIIRERWEHWHTNERVTRIIRAQGNVACQGQLKEMQLFRQEKTEREKQSWDA